MFTIAAFRRHNEMTALLAAGISKSRIVRPIIVAAILFAILAVVNREVVIPSIREKLNYKPQDLLGTTRSLQPIYDNQTDVLLGGKGFQRREQTIVEPSFNLPPQLDRYGRHVTARQAVYRPPQGQRPGGYHFQQLKFPKGLADKPSLMMGQRPILITPRDADWLQPDECFVVSGVAFEHLSGGQAWRRFSSTPEMIQVLSNSSVQHGADLQVKIHARFVKPILDVTLLFLGLPLVLARQTHNLFVSVGLCVLLVLAYMLVILGCHYLGASLKIGPALAAWIPLMIFVPLAVNMSEPLCE